jgi:hypothetical protein
VVRVLPAIEGYFAYDLVPISVLADTGAERSQNLALKNRNGIGGMIFEHREARDGVDYCSGSLAAENTGKIRD